MLRTAQARILRRKLIQQQQQVYGYHLSGFLCRGSADRTLQQPPRQQESMRNYKQRKEFSTLMSLRLDLYGPYELLRLHVLICSQSNSPAPAPKSASPNAGNSASTVNGEMYIADGDYIKDIEVNDLRNRYTLTRGSTQKMVNIPCVNIALIHQVPFSSSSKQLSSFPSKFLSSFIRVWDFQAYLKRDSTQCTPLFCIC